MTRERRLGNCIGICACLALTTALPATAQTASSVASTTNSSSSPTHGLAATAPSYNSDPTFGTSSNEDFNNPENDARPGVYYFKIATNAFKRGHYGYAIDMYKVAASWAYKPAEYNLGVMYYRGQGVPEDRARGAAWMTLAAERKTPQYVAARDLMITPLSDAEFARVNILWKQLSPTYGDAFALHRAKVRWAQVRAGKTGSRTGGIAGPLRVGSEGGPGAPKSGKDGSGAPLHTNTSGVEITSGHDMNGELAYRQFRESDNPYDPKFKTDPSGTVSVGVLLPLQAAKGNAATDRTQGDSSSGDKTGHL